MTCRNIAVTQALAQRPQSPWRLPQAVLPGEKVVALAAGNYGGQSAMAVGLSVATQKWMVKGSVTTGVSGHGSVGAGVGYRW
ncbi:YadA C-terminal domain-containing protein [Paraburkholderia sediminicola]|uniref:YadA C-terminal domain-containing protein n=1 Tax=Paraburkholderia sediminicola TaxID=458836 RepID=UPI0038B92662